MKPARFDYIRAETLAEVHAGLADNPDARVIAGGQTLMPMLSMRLARPPVVIDIMRIGKLAAIEETASGLRVGAAVRQAQLLNWPGLADSQPLLAAALPWVGHAQTRNRGTVCGSIAHADPSAEIPLALVTLNGEIGLSSRKKSRRVPAGEFFKGLLSTERADDELIEFVVFPKRIVGAGYAFREFGRRHGDFAIVACAAVVNGDAVRLAVGGIADRPVARDFGALTEKQLDAAIDDFAWSLEARDDLHATASYRRGLLRNLAREVIGEARQCRA